MRRLALAIALLLFVSGPAFAQLEGTLNLGGGGGGGVSSVSGSAPITSTGGTTPNIALTSPLAVQYGGRGCGSAGFVASLPISPVEGAICPVTDSLNDCNDGNTVNGGGTHHCYVFWNNLSWQMFGTAAGTVNLVNPMTTLGDVIYENATPAATRLAGNITSTKKFLSQTGTGSISAVPAWSALACSDLPALTGDTTTSAGSCATTTSAVQGNSLVPHRVTTSGATLSVSLATSLNQFITLHDSITLTFSAAPADGNVVRFKLTQNNGGSHTVTWPGTVQWPSAAAPTLTTTDGQADFIQCLYDGTTTNYACSSVLNFTP